MKYYDEIVVELFEHGIAEYKDKQYKVEEIPQPQSPCFDCPLFEKHDNEICNLCIALDFYAYVDRGNSNRFRLKEVSK